MFLTVLLCALSWRSLWALDYESRHFEWVVLTLLSLRFLHGPHLLNTALRVRRRQDLVAVIDDGSEDARGGGQALTFPVVPPSWGSPRVSSVISLLFLGLL